MMKKYISGPSQAAFPMAIMAFAGFIMLAGFGVMIEYGIIGLLMVLFSSFILFSRSGFEIDVVNQRAREYTSIFGIASGKWQSIEGYDQASLLSSRLSSTTYSRTNRATSSQHMVFKVCLLDDTHLRKVIVYQTTSKLRARAFLDELIEHLEVKEVRYSPKKLRPNRRSKNSR